MKKFACTIILMLFTASVFSQINTSRSNIEQKKYHETILYKVVKGKIIVPVAISGKEYNFLFDTGSPFALYDNVSDEQELVDTSSITINDINNIKRQKTTFILPEFKLGNVTFLNSGGLILNKGDSQTLDCFEVDGVIGSSVLKNSVVQINSREKTLTITDSAGNLSLKRKDALPLGLDKNQSTPYFKIRLQKKPKAEDYVVIDTGSDGFFTMSNRMYRIFKEDKIEAVKTLAETEGVSTEGFFGAGSSQNNVLIRLDNLPLKNFEFKNIIAGVSQIENSYLGTKLLDFGVLTIDYSKKRLYFKPYESTNYEELTRQPWSIQPILHNGKMAVGLIWDKSLESTVNPGDEILQFGDVDYQSKTLCEMVLEPSTSNQKNTETVVLRDINTGEIKEVEISRSYIK